MPGHAVVLRIEPSWRLAPSAFIADASALDGAARYACPPGIGSTPIPAALCLAPLAIRLIDLQDRMQPRAA